MINKLVRKISPLAAVLTLAAGVLVVPPAAAANGKPVASSPKVEGEAYCAEGYNVRQYIVDSEPTFSAWVAEDGPAGTSALVRLELKAVPVDGGDRLTGVSGNSGSNGFIGVQASGAFDLAKRYRWQLRPVGLNGDGSVRVYGTWTKPCELAFDTATIAHPPIVEGIPTLEFDGIAYLSMEYGKPAEVTFRAHPDDVGKVAAFRYGFDDYRFATVAAEPDGSAKVVMTHWALVGPDPDSRMNIRVEAVTIAGHSRSVYTEEAYNMLLEAPPINRVTGDFHGDGLADLIGVQPLLSNRSLIYSYPGKADGTLGAPARLAELHGVSQARRVQGDINGDGKTDIVSVIATDENDIRITTLPSNGNEMAETEVWSSGWQPAQAGRWSLPTLQVLAGDVNADGLDDLVVANPGAGGWMLEVFLATGSPGIPFADPVNWLAAPATSDLGAMDLTIGQFDGVPGFDVAGLLDQGGCRTGLVLFANLGSQPGFGPGQQVWDSGPGAFCAGAVAGVAAGAYGGPTAKHGIAVAYSGSDCNTAVYTFTPDAGAASWTSAVKQWDSAEINQAWCQEKVDIALRDLTGDGKADLLVTQAGDQAYRQRIWLHPSVGAVTGADIFGDPALLSDRTLGPLNVQVLG